MARDLTPSVIAESLSEAPRPFILVKLEFDIGTIRLNSTDRDLTVDVDGDGDQTYQGVGNLGQISTMEETSELRPTGIVLTLSGIQPSYISIALGAQYQGRSVKIWEAFFDSSYAVVADPILQWSGLIDTMDISMGETAAIRLTAEHKLIRWEEPKLRRYTNEDQQEQFTGDKGLEFVNQTTEKEIIWGRTGAR